MKTKLMTLWLLTLALPAFAFDFFEPVKPPRPFEVMAHRGALHQAPENTRPALKRCAEDGIEWAEVDVRLSKDHQHVILHDSVVDGKTNGTGRVQDLTVEELKKLDAGSWFAPKYANEKLLTLKECLALAKNKLNLYLDCKHIDPALLVKDVLDAGMEHQVIVYEDLDVAARIHKLSHGKIAVMSKWHPNNGTAEWLDKSHLDAVEIDASDILSAEVTPEVCGRFHEKGIKVQAKVLGDADRAEVWDKVIAAGVDWLQTDFAEEIIAHRMWQLRTDRPVQISCHRGANRYAPENTLPAFEKAIKLGVDYVEFDVRTSKDGKFFILHDGDFDRTTNGKGPLDEAEGEAIRALDAGAWFGKPFRGLKVPTLDETLGALKGKMLLYVDAKQIAPEALAEKLKEFDLADKGVVYQGPDYLRKLHDLNPAIRGLCPLDDPKEVDALVESVHPYAFDTSWKILSADLIRHCHDLGVKVFSDALGLHERVDDYVQAIQWGIDVIQTNYPLRVIRAVEIRQAR